MLNFFIKLYAFVLSLSLSLNALVPAESMLRNLLSSSSNPRDMEQARYWMWTRTRFNRPLVVGSSLGESSWEEKAFAEDLGGCTWPPRSYSCSFCRRDFRSAQALGGHMNVHRKDRARLKQSPSLDEEAIVQGQPDKHQLPLVGTTHFVFRSDAAANPNPNPKPNSGIRESPPTPASTDQKELLLFTSRSLKEKTPPPLHLFIVPQVKIGEDNLSSVEFVSIDAGINICNKRRRIDEPNTCFFIAEQEVLHADVLNQIKPFEELDLELRLGFP